MSSADIYMMENMEESIRLEVKTDPVAVKQQATWCGIEPGMRILDAGCGPGVTTSILHKMIQPNGEIIGVDYSKDRIDYARKKYGQGKGIYFKIQDVRHAMDHLGLFDLIWVRFVLEYNRKEGLEIVKNLTKYIKPGGKLCLLDLDHNGLNHYELPGEMETILYKLVDRLQNEFNFDPYSGRKLYSYLYDSGYMDIRVEVIAHHLIYGDIKDEDLYNWLKKVEVISMRVEDLFQNYPGGSHGFFRDFNAFFSHPRRFTYTPLTLSRGTKPES
ncbi:MAG: class I SAM-dependent methyltransferase [Deltaproteobacteria bacterium]|nr:class I SAM-dependent methyltransferase [Deltaproteobacteria bacterium]